MKRPLAGFLKLPGHERTLLLLLAIGLPVLSLGLRVFGFNKVRRFTEISSRRNPHPASAQDMAAAQRLAILAGVAGRHGPIHTSCLRQSLVVYWLLRRRGLQPDLKLGAAMRNGIPDMHAWVELQGQALGQNGPRYSPFPLP